MIFLGTFIWIAKWVVGIGLPINCIRGLFSDEGKYDAESTRIMQWSNIVGILIGIALLTNALGLYNIPFVPFF